MMLALAGGADWIPAMAGSLHPPCRRKKLRPLRPRLTARTALCSGPSSSPHAAGRAGAPVFLARRKRENGPCTVQKRKRSIAPAGGRGTRDAQEVLPPGTHVSCPRRGASGSFGDGRMDQLLFPLPLTWRLRKAPAGYCARSSAINCAPKRTPS